MITPPPPPENTHILWQEAAHTSEHIHGLVALCKIARAMGCLDAWLVGSKTLQVRCGRPANMWLIWPPSWPARAPCEQLKSGCSWNLAKQEDPGHQTLSYKYTYSAYIAC